MRKYLGLFPQLFYFIVIKISPVKLHSYMEGSFKLRHFESNVRILAFNS